MNISKKKFIDQMKRRAEAKRFFAAKEVKIFIPKVKDFDPDEIIIISKHKKNKWTNTK